jgi:N-acetylglucosaminyldiphosphoundecaprenol N-acetyl-beta-D-mannosaminyltransferase
MNHLTAEEIVMAMPNTSAMDQGKVFNFPITLGKYSFFITQILNIAEQKVSANVCVANVHMLVEAYKDHEFRKVISRADIVTPDGKPLVWALRLFAGLRQDRVAGMDMLPELLRAMEQNKLSAYFYGGDPNMLGNTEQYLTKNFPDLKIAGLFSPPYRSLNGVEENRIADEINRANANIVFVVLGCPKQEKWMAAMKGKINAVMIGVGGALPVTIGSQKRAPFWMQDNGLEWFYRLVQEPGRLLKRYAFTNTVFLYLFCKEGMKLILSKYQIKI